MSRNLTIHISLIKQLNKNTVFTHKETMMKIKNNDSFKRTQVRPFKEFNIKSSQKLEYSNTPPVFQTVTQPNKLEYTDDRFSSFNRKN